MDPEEARLTENVDSNSVLNFAADEKAESEKGAENTPLTPLSTSYNSISNGKHEVIEMAPSSPKGKPVFTCSDEGFWLTKQQSEWINEKFKVKRCNCFIPTEKERTLCQCGRYKSNHKWDYTEAEGISWDSDKHAEQIPLVNHGLIQFVYDDIATQQNIWSYHQAQFLRIPDNAESIDLTTYIYEVWNIQKPRLVLSFHGGCLGSKIPVQLRRKLKFDIIKFLKTTKVWLLTDGTGGGLSEFIGNVFQTYVESMKKDVKNVCLGFSSWGNVVPKFTDNEQLCQNRNQYVMSRPSDAESCRLGYLDEHHTHHVIVDNGSTNESDADINSRNSLLKHLGAISKRSMALIMVLLGGDLKDLEMVMDNMSSSIAISVILVKGNGGVADVLVECLKMCFENDKCIDRSLVKEIIHEKVGPHVDNEWIAGLINFLIAYKQKIVILDDNEESSIRDAVLSTFNGTDKKGCLYSCISGDVNHVERSRKVITCQEDEIYGMLLEDIKNTRLVSARNLLETGIDLVPFIQNLDVDSLYLLENVRQTSFAKIAETLELDDSKQSKKQDHVLVELTEEDVSLTALKNPVYNFEKLLIWTVLTDKPAMTRLLFDYYTSTPMVTALVLSRLYQNMSEMCCISKEAKKIMVAEKKYFKTFSIQLLATYEETNEQLAAECILAKHEVWGKNNVVVLSSNMYFQSFIAHESVYKILSDTWNGNIVRDRTILKSISDNSKKCSKRKEIKIVDVLKRQCKKTFTPKRKFFIEAFFYAFFLGLFSYVIHKNIQTTDHSVEEYITLSMVVAYFFDEIRQLAMFRKNSSKQRLISYIRGIWNCLDVISIVLFFTGFFCRYFNGLLVTGRIFYAFDIVIWYCKLLQFYRVSKTLGPYVAMVLRMIKPLVSFLAVLAVAVLGFGLFQHTLLYSSETSSGWRAIFEMLFNPYTIVFGELGIDHTLQTNTTVFNTAKFHNGITEPFAIVGTCLFLMVSNVLMINVLIAVFNNIYVEVAENVDMIWRIELFEIVNSFTEKSCIPPPFSILVNLCLFLKYCGKSINRFLQRRQCTGKCPTATSKVSLYRLLREYEGRCMQKFLYTRSEKEKYSKEKTKANLETRYKTICQQLEKLSEEVSKLNTIGDM